MSKAFTRESEDEGGELPKPAPAPVQGKNYMTPAWHARMKSELKKLVEVERPETVRIVSWAASNGDRSENGDYIYGKRRLREIDHRIRYLMKRLEAAEVVDPRDHDGDAVYFGATVLYCDESGAEHRVSIVGIDESDPSRGRVSGISPVARALLRAREGDTVRLNTPSGVQQLDVLEIRYDPLD